jgi:hypothetical protein
MAELDVDELIKKALEQYNKPQSEPWRTGLATMAMGLLANNQRGNLWEGLGKGGLLGMEAMQAERTRQQKDPAAMISLLNAVEDFKANRDMAGLFKGMGPQASGPPQFQPAPGLPADAPQQNFGMSNRSGFDNAPNAITGKPIPPEAQSGYMGSMVTPPPQFTGSIPPPERLLPFLGRPKTTAAAQNIADFLGYKTENVPGGATRFVRGQPSFTAPIQSEGMTTDATGTSRFIPGWLENKVLAEQKIAGAKKAGEDPYQPAVPVPTGNPDKPGETVLVSPQAQRTIGAANAIPFLAPPQPQAPPPQAPAPAQLRPPNPAYGPPNLPPEVGGAWNDWVNAGRPGGRFKLDIAPGAPPLPNVPGSADQQPSRIGVAAGPVAEKVAEVTRSAPPEIQKGAQVGANTDFITNEYRPALVAAQSAVRSKAALDVLDNKDIRTGWGTTAAATAGSVLAGMGMAPDAVKSFVTDSQIFHKQVQAEVNRKMVLNKGVQTEGDAARSALIESQLTDTEQANQFTRDIARAQYNQDIAKGKFYSANYAAAIRSGDPFALEEKWRDLQPSLFDDPAMKKWAIREAPAKTVEGKNDPAATLKLFQRTEDEILKRRKGMGG